MAGYQSKSNNHFATNEGMVRVLMDSSIGYARFSRCFSLAINDKEKSHAELSLCDLGKNQRWMWNGENLLLVDSQCLTVEQDLEIWSVPLVDASHSVLLLNRNSQTSEPITIYWTDFGWPNNRTVLVRDLWTQMDLGHFISNYTSPPIGLHAVQMLKMTPST